MFKRNQAVMLLAVASLGMPLSAVAEISADPATADPAAATVHDHEADRLPTRQRVEDRCGGADGGLHRRAAVLLAAGEIARHHDFEVLGRLQQQLAAHGVEILVVVVGLAARAAGFSPRRPDLVGGL